MDRIHFKTATPIFILAVMTVFASGAWAQDAAEQAMPPGMDEEMMARMKDFSTPNENHRVLDYFVGDWDYTLTMWMAPDVPPEKSSGWSQAKWIMDGHFLEQTFEGEAMGAPFTGRMTLGFDNLKKEYVSTWVDNMSTGIMTSTATYDPAAKTFMEQGSHSCPIDNGTRHFRAVTRIIDENTYSYETFTTAPDGKEYKGMEIIYNKKRL
jgi:hypothetical protein